MEPLHYTSREMFSSTELIRKNKMIFDKLSKKEIDKAVILRDGKPSFMLLAFDEYEKLMNEYLSLKANGKNKEEKISLEKKVTKYNEEIKIEEKVIEKEIGEEELANALEEIENLDLDYMDEKIEKTTKDEKEPLKEFWE
ncbi:hypothetical protein [Halarcobacter ebronensis]|uniref:Antitoxin n=1 Tax=Halarcobacter ebronensis TaxID=1462615 RepID=A0A4Q1AYL5_9BACT|nr:hypothetical protein [Halarcobacter ebronensis]QKF80684.1 hypothetical protein AEBR_0167 [Halarcobacter ebronensis]RXK08481.1 hypothetical protein CRV07_01380 [Halarcobacter ebronensis]